MRRSRLMDQYMEQLLQGRRKQCRSLVWGALEHGAKPKSLYFDLMWPAMEEVEQLYREDRINIATEHMATRINRFVADQVQGNLKDAKPNGKRIVVTCADGEREELGAQRCTDLFESEGWEAYFLGGGVPNDEILSLVGQIRPEILLIYGMKPQGVPGARAVIDLIREVGVNPTMNIMVSGGVFNRAPDLWKEINADLFAESARDALKVAGEAIPRIPEVRIPGAPKKRRRRRKSPLLLEASAITSGR